jgi:hypothetical protein
MKTHESSRAYVAFVPPSLFDSESELIRLLQLKQKCSISPKYRRGKRKRLSHYYSLAMGEYITQWGSEGTGPGQFDDPWGVAVDASGNVYVADTNNSRIQMFCYGQTAVQNRTWGRIKSMFR